MTPPKGLPVSTDAEGGEQEAGVDGVAHGAVRASRDEFVVLFDRRARAQFRPRIARAQIANAIPHTVNAAATQPRASGG